MVSDLATEELVGFLQPSLAVDLLCQLALNHKPVTYHSVAHTGPLNVNTDFVCLPDPAWVQYIRNPLGLQVRV